MQQFGIIQFELFFAGLLLIIMLPGPNSLFVLKTSIGQGRIHALYAIGAVLLGDAVLILAAYLGVAASLQTSPSLFDGIRMVGASYLAFIAIQLMRAAFQSDHTPTMAMQAPTPALFSPPITAFRKALLLSLTNPKAILFFVSFFIQFIDVTFSPSYLPYFVLAFVLEVVSLCYLLLLMLVGRQLSRWVAAKPFLARIGNLAVGVLFAGFAIRLFWFG